MTTITHAAQLDTALASIATAAIQRARLGNEVEIEQLLRAHTDRLHSAATALLAAKPDPMTWTPHDHVTFLLAGSVPTGFDAPSNLSARKPPAPTAIQSPAPAARTAEQHRIGDEIPF